METHAFTCKATNIENQQLHGRSIQNHARSCFWIEVDCGHIHQTFWRCAAPRRPYELKFPDAGSHTSQKMTSIQDEASMHDIHVLVYIYVHVYIYIYLFIYISMYGMDVYILCSIYVGEQSTVHCRQAPRILSSGSLWWSGSRQGHLREAWPNSREICEVPPLTSSNDGPWLIPLVFQIIPDINRLQNPFSLKLLVRSCE